MNIFYLHSDPVLAAEYHCDKHINKMIIEYAQLLSTAHRMLDGTYYQGQSPRGRAYKGWRHINESLYKATHINHPSNIWARQSKQNYEWLYDLFKACVDERMARYGRGHATWDKLGAILSTSPANVPNIGMTPIPLCMPDKYKVACPVESYRNFYNGDKASFAKWTNRPVPGWFNG